MMAVATFLVVLPQYGHLDAAHEAFNVRQHLSTVSRFGALEDITDN